MTILYINALLLHIFFFFFSIMHCRKCELASKLHRSYIRCLEINPYYVNEPARTAGIYQTAETSLNSCGNMSKPDGPAVSNVGGNQLRMERPCIAHAALQMPGELRSCEPIDYTVEKMYNWRTFERNGSHFNRDNFPTIAATSIVIATRIITW